MLWYTEPADSDAAYERDKNYVMSPDIITHHSNGPRVAFLDLLFCWPPNGGADVDLFHVARGLYQRGLTVQVFVLHLEGVAGRGCVDAESMPFPTAKVSVPPHAHHRAGIIDAVKSALAEWRPDVVFLMHGYALKADMALALADWPLAGRYYAHELMCARDGFRFKDNVPCPYDYLRNPEHCRRCALASLAPGIKSGRGSAWIQDYLMAGAYRADYHGRLLAALSAMKHIIVYNRTLCAELGPFRSKAYIIPGGTEIEKKDNIRKSDNKDTDPLMVLMSGRVEDPAKGLDVLLKASARLKASSRRLHIVVTHFDPRMSRDGVTATGWLSHEETQALYRRADICVVPSLWHEPFGLVAVEAMGAGLPVCVSDTGGLREIVVHERTGLLFPAGDAGALAACLTRLYDDASLRYRLGEAARAHILNRYVWDTVIETHYIPLLEAISHD